MYILEGYTSKSFYRLFCFEIEEFNFEHRIARTHNIPITAMGADFRISTLIKPINYKDNETVYQVNSPLRLLVGRVCLELFLLTRNKCCTNDGRLFENCVSVRRSSEPTGRPCQKEMRSGLL